MGWGLPRVDKWVGEGVKKVAKGTTDALGKVAKTAYDISPTKGLVEAGKGVIAGDLGQTIRGAAQMAPGVNMASMAAKKLAAEGAAQNAASAQAQAPASTAAPAGTTAAPTIPVPAPITSVSGSEFLPEEYKQVLAARQAQLQGFSAPELAAQRAEMGSQLGAAEKQRQRDLAASLARSGVRGGAAAALQSRAGQQSALEQGKLAQDMFIRDIMQKQAAQGAYEQALGGAMGVAGKQQFLPLAAQIAQEQLRTTKDIAGMQAGAIEKYGQAMAPAPSQPGAFSNFFSGLFG